MNETTRFLDGRVKRSKELSRKVREVIYDLAVTGREFSVYDIADKLNQHEKGSINMIARNLMGARMAGFLVETEKRRIVQPVSPLDWIAGTPNRDKRAKFYKGSDKIMGGTRK